MTENGLGAEGLRDLVRNAATVASQTDLENLLEATVVAGMDLTGASYGALGVLGEHGNLTQFSYRGIDEKTADKIGALPQGTASLADQSRTWHLAVVCIRLDAVGVHTDGGVVVGAAVGVRYFTALDRLSVPGTGRGRAPLGRSAGQATRQLC